MATGTYEKMKLVFERQAGDGTAEVDQPNIKVYKAGPFFECRIDNVFVGKVMKWSECLVSPYMTKESGEDLSECSGRCIKLKNHIIVLSMLEFINMAYEVTVDRDGREERANTALKASTILDM